MNFARLFCVFCVFYRSNAQRYRFMEAFLPFVRPKPFVVSRETFALRALAVIARATEVFLLMNQKTCFSYVFRLENIRLAALLSLLFGVSCSFLMRKIALFIRFGANFHPASDFCVRKQSNLL